MVHMRMRNQNDINATCFLNALKIRDRILLCGLSYTGIQKDATIVAADINTASTDFSCSTSKYEFHKSVPFRNTSLMISEISRNHNDPDSGALD